MNRLLPALLLMLSLAPRLLGDSLALLWFEGNRAYFSEVLCENKDRPEMGCKGQCQLAKMLDTPEEPLAPVLPETPEALPFILIALPSLSIPLAWSTELKPDFDPTACMEWKSTPAIPPPRA